MTTPPPHLFPALQQMAHAIRFLAIDAVEKAKSGHPGMPMGMADVATVLFTHFMQFNPQDPHWPNRDRFILSNGHGSMLQYALAYLMGYPSMTLDQLQRFRQLGSLTQGHPEHHVEVGIETTTGPLGQGLANAVGMALAEEQLRQTFPSLINHHTYVFLGDGCLMEGISHEAASFAGHHRLGKLIAFFDDNAVTIDGPLNLSCSDDTGARFQAYGWQVISVDGHNHQALFEAIVQAQADPRPSLICCKTVIGFGSPHKAGLAASHGSPLGAQETLLTREHLGWDSPPFQIPQDILDHWRAVPHRCAESYRTWRETLKTLPLDRQQNFQNRFVGKLPVNWSEGVDIWMETLAEARPKMATRQASGQALKEFQNQIPELWGGSADLTESTQTQPEGETALPFIHYGIREHAMAAIMNGLALHGGFIPYGGTFLVFSDYCRPAIRLSALMKQRVIYVMTHDSIGLGEDGPTHQPIEHLASLRAIPNLAVLRPADAIEVGECWKLALEGDDHPSVLVLSRQGLPTLRHDISQNLCAQGAYLLKDAPQRDLTLIATGSEVSLALEVAALLEEAGKAVAVVSMPSWFHFHHQSPWVQEQVLGPRATRFAIEAASPFGWERFVPSPHIFGIETFGASAPGDQLYEHFGLTPSALAAKIQTYL